MIIRFRHDDGSLLLLILWTQNMSQLVLLWSCTLYEEDPRDYYFYSIIGKEISRFPKNCLVWNEYSYLFILSNYQNALLTLPDSSTVNLMEIEINTPSFPFQYIWSYEQLYMRESWIYFFWLGKKILPYVHLIRDCNTSVL